jgi:hypothetical protein
MISSRTNDRTDFLEVFLRLGICLRIGIAWDRAGFSPSAWDASLLGHVFIGRLNIETPRVCASSRCVVSSQTLRTPYTSVQGPKKSGFKAVNPSRVSLFLVILIMG